MSQFLDGFGLLGPSLPIFGVRRGCKTYLMSTDKYQQLLLPMYPFTLPVNFELNLESFWDFRGQTAHWGVGSTSETDLGPSHSY